MDGINWKINLNEDELDKIYSIRLTVQVRVAGRFGGKKVNSLANLDDGQIIGLLPTPHSGIWNIVNRNFVDLIIDHGRRPPPLLSAPILGAVAHRE